MVTGVPGPCVGNTVAIPRLGYPGLCLQDGPLAIRVTDYASVFPAGVSAAASFDRELIYERGVAMGAEFRGKGAHVALGLVQFPSAMNIF
jgi:beta-glucosidase